MDWKQFVRTRTRHRAAVIVLVACLSMFAWGGIHQTCSTPTAQTQTTTCSSVGASCGVTYWYDYGCCLKWQSLCTIAKSPGSRMAKKGICTAFWMGCCQCKEDPYGGNYGYVGVDDEICS